MLQRGELSSQCDGQRYLKANLTASAFGLICCYPVARRTKFNV